MPQKDLAPLPLTAVRPKGWLLDKVKTAPGNTLDDRLAKAFILGDETLMDVAEREMAALLASDAPPSRDALRALLRYHGVSGDKRVGPYLLRYAKELRDALSEGPVFTPAQAQDVSDLLRALLWLYNITGQKVLLELCRMVRAQAPDWMSTLHIFPQTKPVAASPDPAEDAYFRVQGAAIAASLKTPALQALFEGGLKNETAFRIGWDKLVRYHGAAHGLFNADPLLAGANPSRAVEPETVSELLYTLETLCWAQGDAFAGDLMESIALGALPAAQGPQAANQITGAKGLVAGGFAQYAASLWMATADGGLAAISYAPCEARWRIGGHAVRVTVETAYPCEETVRIHVQMKGEAEFPLHLRIPAWAGRATAQVGDEPPIACAPGYAVIQRVWRGGDVLTLTLPMDIRVTRRYHQSVSVERGPLVYALPVEQETAWNLALLPEKGMEVAFEKDMPVVYAYAAPVTGWGKSGGRPASPPIDPPVDAAEVCKVRLVPYGATVARMSQFPVGNLQQGG